MPERNPPGRPRCPVCGRPAPPRQPGARGPWPFCSDRCRQVDLGRWLSGAYALPMQEPQARAGEEEG
ncbi:DNA gyrase inhibitor YacG [Rubritepida flocculans]|uniref:DNA gyrase inhibitor YacG n=1 Tax=Rubritepida flocculans TaxID=182403 RepID=UPI00041ABFC1|nr:DNA gyrase inhibitor YacG [Rubritepida flocculans]